MTPAQVLFGASLIIAMLAAALLAPFITLIGITGYVLTCAFCGVVFYSLFRGIA